MLSGQVRATRPSLGQGTASKLAPMMGIVLSAVLLVALIYLCRRAYVRGSHSALTSALACTCAMASVLMPAMGAHTASDIIYLLTGGAVGVVVSWSLAWVHSTRGRALASVPGSDNQAASSAVLAHVLQGVGTGFLSGIAWALWVYAVFHMALH